MDIKIIESTILYKIYFIIYFQYLFNNISFFHKKINVDFIINHYKCYKYSHWPFSKEKIIVGLLFIFLRAINFFNELDYKNYIKNCPFALNTDLISFNESIYGKRRCELYNKNMNSRYKYQYLCSYNASEDFKRDKTKDGFDKVICLPKINDIINNDIIKTFNEVYKNINKNDSSLFYCSRIDEPKKNEYIKDEYCKEENIYISLINFLLFLYDFLGFFHTQLNKDLADDINQRSINLINDLRQQINRMLDNEDHDTEYDESNSSNESFDEEEDKNIIVEDHHVYNAEFNFKDYVENGEKPKND